MLFTCMEVEQFVTELVTLSDGGAVTNCISWL